ncbi:restriction endonuclease [Epilithonimonas vandammei]|nr:restriction endonuclease [Epilithonimonas vandammei]
MEYDFSKLNDREFENLAASIIEKELKNRVEIFKSGRDGGVDGRFWIGEKN